MTRTQLMELLSTAYIEFEVSPFSITIKDENDSTQNVVFVFAREGKQEFEEIFFNCDD